MKINSVVATDIDLKAVYKLCFPIDRKKCIEAIRETVDFQIRMRATEGDGWVYPCEEFLAGDLIEHGLAIPAN